MGVDIGAVYLSRPTGLRDDEKYLWESLIDAAKSATRIDIVSGYTTCSKVIELLKSVPTARQPSCEVNILICPDRFEALSQANETKSSIEEWVRKSKFSIKRVRVGIADPSQRHIHVKLFRFTAGKRPTWFIGSANLTGAITGNREELMIKLTGAHPPLKHYIERLIETGSVSQIFKGRTHYRSLNDAVSAGRMIVKYDRQIQLTFDGIKNSKDIAEKLLEAVVSTLTFGDPETSGLKFSFAKAVGLVNISAPPENESKSGSPRFSLASTAVETDYGYWCPEGAISKIDSLLTAAGSKKMKELTELRESLRADGIATLWGKYQQHLIELKSGTGVAPQESSDTKERFEKFYNRLLIKLDEQETLDRTSRKYRISEVPPVFSYETASEKFLKVWASEIIYFGAPEGSQNRRALHSALYQLAIEFGKVKIDLDVEELIQGLGVAVKQGGWSPKSFTKEVRAL